MSGKFVLVTPVAIVVISETIPLFFDVFTQFSGSVWIESVEMGLVSVNR